ncbi:SDR family NAD(P)-dependent oxidoreductase [Falsiroseomonas oryzae]|uniref:SDR family NAD(P)-dependent oxidoreductase n=1 Tax=Falsiroseomonas oryzae TaxID=2766473 RepID=UPI0022EAAF4B|nr:SDR family NAD(P)-dependent oxidoreductase [Roseomonas sp. MO-31]
MSATARPLALVTGASSGIGLELARLCAQHGHDLLLGADRPLGEAEAALRAEGAQVETVQADLATLEGVDRLVDALAGRHVAVLCANAGHGLGHAFLDQPWPEIRHVIDTNVTGTVYLLHRLGSAMRGAGQGRILVTGSIAGYTPQPFQAVYHATKAFIDNFTIAFREELKESGVSVTLLMPGATETEFFDRAGMEDTKLGQSKKDDAADVAKTGFEAMLRGDADVVYGMKNKVTTALADVMPAETSARMASNQARPGSGKKSA